VHCTSQAGEEGKERKAVVVREKATATRASDVEKAAARRPEGVRGHGRVLGLLPEPARSSASEV
jgi:hypothetical protein